MNDLLGRVAPRPERPGWARLVGCGVVLAALTSCEFWILGPASWIYGYGGMLETLPFHLGLQHSGALWSGWEPFAAGGADRLAAWGNADPLNLEPLLLATLPVWAANGVHAFLQRFIAFVFTALLARDVLKLPGRWCLAAGAAHLGFSYYTFGAMFTSPLYPGLIWGLHALSGLPTTRALMGAAALGLVAAPFTTFVHGVPYLLAAVAGWFVIVTPQRTWRFAAIGMIFAAVFVLAESRQLVALLAQAADSSRSQYPAEPGASWSLRGAFYLEPEFDLFNQDKWLKFLGRWIPVAAAASILVRRFGRKGEPGAVPGAGIALFYALLSLRFIWVGVRGIVAQALPWADGIYMGRFFTVAYPTLAGLIVALALQDLFSRLQRPATARLVRGVVVAAAVLTLHWPKGSLWRDLMVDSPGAIALDNPNYRELKLREKLPFRVASVLDLTPAFAYANGLEAADGWGNLYSGRYRQLWLRVLDPLFAALPANRQIFAPDGKRPQDGYIFLGTSLLNPGLGVLPGEDTSEALRQGFNMDRRFRLNLLSLINVKYLLAEHPLKGETLALAKAPKEPPPAVCRDYATGKINFPRRPWTTESGLPDIPAWWADTRDGVRRKLVAPEPYIYEIQDSLPRFRSVAELRRFPTPEAALDALTVQPVDGMRRTAYAADGDPGTDGLDGPFENAEVEVVSYSADVIHLRVTGTGSRFLASSMVFNRYWTATVDGDVRPPSLINHAFIGLRLRGTESEIVFRYAPPYGFFGY